MSETKSKELTASKGSISAVTLAKEFKISVGELQTIQNTIARGATLEELKLFLFQAKRTKLDPFSRQIHLVKRGDTAVIQTGIDGYRAIAERTGNYAGSDEPIYDLEEAGKIPGKATVKVWKFVQGQKVSFEATARWAEYFPGEKIGFMWKSKPYLMLGKCAEALALRKAFPNDLSGLYVKEELDKFEAPANQTEEKPAYREVVMTAIGFANSCPEDRIEAIKNSMVKNNFTDEETKAVMDILDSRFEPKNEPSPEDNQDVPDTETTIKVDAEEVAPENPFNKNKK